MFEYVKEQRVGFGMTDFALHSVGLIMFARGLGREFAKMAQEFAHDYGMRILRLSVDEYGRLVEVANRYGLDFDDAYQYVVAQREGLRIVSYDADFDKTPQGRITPEAAVELGG